MSNIDKRAKKIAGEAELEVCNIGTTRAMSDAWRSRFEAVVADALRLREESRCWMRRVDGLTCLQSKDPVFCDACKAIAAHDELMKKYE